MNAWSEQFPILKSIVLYDNEIDYRRKTIYSWGKSPVHIDVGNPSAWRGQGGRGGQARPPDRSDHPDRVT